MKRNQYRVGTILSYISIFLGNLVGIIYTPIMLRYLGQAEYGLYSLVGSLIATLSLVDLGFGNAAIRYISKYKAMGDKEKEYNVNGMFILINIVIMILSFIIGLIFYKFSGDLFTKGLSHSELEKFKLMLVILIINMGISFPFSVFGSIIVAYERFIFPKVIGIIRTILNPIIIIGILILGYDSIGMVIANTIINIIFLGVNVYYCFKKLKVRFYFKNFNLVLLKEISIYSSFIFIAIVVDKIYWATDQILLGIFSGTVAVSVYAIASQINMYYMQFSTAISGMFLPRITSMVTNNSGESELTNLFIKIGRIQYIILGLILSGFILFGKEFIIIWAGTSYTEAYYIALILIAPFTIPLIQNIGLSILQAKNMHKFRSIVLLIIAVGNFLISIPLTKTYGGVGSAVGTAISMIIGNIVIMNVYYYKKIRIDIPRFWKEISLLSLPIFLSFLLGYILQIFFVSSGIMPIIIKIMIFSIMYTCVLYFIGMNRFEKSIVISLIRGVKKVSIRKGNLQKGY